MTDQDRTLQGWADVIERSGRQTRHPCLGPVGNMRNQLANIVAAYVKAELAMSDRHHGPKGRKAKVMAMIFSRIGAGGQVSKWLDWAVATGEMRLYDMPPEKIGAVLATNWIHTLDRN